MFQWYVINTYSGHENKVKANLEHRIESMGQRQRFRRVVDQQHDQRDLGIVGRDRIADVLQQKRLAGSRRGDDQGPLTLAQRSEQSITRVLSGVARFPIAASFPG